MNHIKLVRLSDFECFNWRALFLRIMRPTQFLLPIDPEHRYRFSRIEVLLKKYDSITPWRLKHLPRSSRISRSVLREMEPNLRNNYFDGALSSWEFTVDPQKLLRELDTLASGLPAYQKILIKPGSMQFELGEGRLEAIWIETLDENRVKIFNKKKPAFPGERARKISHGSRPVHALNRLS